jgi:hypothetical protein
VLDEQHVALVLARIHSSSKVITHYQS